VTKHQLSKEATKVAVLTPINQWRFYVGDRGHSPGTALPPQKNLAHLPHKFFFSIFGFYSNFA